MILYRFSNYSILPKKVFLGLTLAIVLGSIFEIWLLNRLSTYGVEITKLEASQNALRQENLSLKNKIDERSSLLEIQKKASELGFESVKSIQYLQAP